MSELSGYEVRRTIHALDKLEERMAAWRKEEDDIIEMRRQIQMECPHIWKYHPDASGNNDDGNCCDLCGLWD